MQAVLKPVKWLDLKYRWQMTAKLHDNWHKQFIVGIRWTLQSTIIFSPTYH